MVYRADIGRLKLLFPLSTGAQGDTAHDRDDPALNKIFEGPPGAQSVRFRPTQNVQNKSWACVRHSKASDLGATRRCTWRRQSAPSRPAAASSLVDCPSSPVQTFSISFTSFAMVVAPKAGEAPVKPIDVWGNQTQKRASLLGLDSPLFGATTIRRLDSKERGRPASMVQSTAIVATDRRLQHDNSGLLATHAIVIKCGQRWRKTVLTAQTKEATRQLSMHVQSAPKRTNRFDFLGKHDAVSFDWPLSAVTRPTASSSCKDRPRYFPTIQ